jgi:hypothetical protein
MYYNELLNRVWPILLVSQGLKAPPHSASPCTASGYLAATCSSTRAGPTGTRRPCSQFRGVRTLIPSMAANCCWVRSNPARMPLMSGGWISKVRAAGISPRRTAPPWRRLATSSANSSFCMGFPRGLCHTGELPDHVNRIL